MDKKRQSRKKTNFTVLVLSLSFGFLMWVTGLFGASLRALGRQLSAQTTDSQGMRGDGAQAADAAFRDGLYVGKIAGERGNKPHISAGRWTTEPDRTAYAAGYLQGYSGAPASAAPRTWITEPLEITE
jgi:hypothetical protein